MTKSQNMVFGVPLDPLDNPETVKLKQAYLLALELQLPIEPNFQSPYDFFHQHLGLQNLTFAGEIETPNWLRPKPTLDVKDCVTQSNFTRFLEQGGCETEARRVYDFVKEHLGQYRPVMLGVDHSSTFGAVKALSEKFDGELALIIFDAHSDIIAEEFIFQRFSGGVASNKGTEEFMQCGNFIKVLVNEKLVKPSNIVIIGVTDLTDDGDNRQSNKYQYLLEENWVSELNLIPQSKLKNPEVIKDVLNKLVPQNVYVSLDVDVGANGALKSARFNQVTGLDQARLSKLFKEVGANLHFQGKRIAGLDVMEIDIHLLEAEVFNLGEAGTKITVESFLTTFLEGGISWWT